jgi:hypothetical protein
MCGLEPGLPIGFLCHKSFKRADFMNRGFGGAMHISVLWLLLCDKLAFRHASMSPH